MLQKVETPPDFDLVVTSRIFFFLNEQITDNRLELDLPLDFNLVA